MATTKSGGCGCGSSGGNCGCAGSCGCGGTICVDESFKRPRFFAGQLLTEDDLDALTDYVVGKNRLRNRYLFGDGVVCGLSVTCHPCGGEKVTVAPGYALDCCGNDILLPCKEELDVKALVRELKQRRLAGYDCGDPCEKKDGTSRSYGLYVTYTETPDALVAPYSSSDPCGQQQCQPSRICEGYKFELRCDCGTGSRVDVFTRMLACVGDLRSAAAAVAKAQVNQVAAQEMQQGLRYAMAEEPVPFTAKSINAMRDAETKLALLDTQAEENDGRALVLNEREVREKAAEYQVLMGALTRFKSQPPETRKALLKKDKELEALVEKSKSTLASSGPVLIKLSAEKVADPAAKIRIEDNVKLAETYAIGEADEASYQTFEARMISVNSPVSTRQAQRMQFDAGVLKSWLIDRLEGSASLTRCDLYDRAVNVRITQVRDDAAGIDGGTVTANKNAVEELVRILIEYFVDCVCLALNPSCGTCEDNSVLLACLTVEDCEVVDICNMSRRFVLSPTAIRYWLPPLTWFGKLAEKGCCGFDLGALIFRDRPRETIRDEQVMVEEAAPSADYVRSMAVMVEQPEPRAMALARTFVPRLDVPALDSDVAVLLEKTRLPVSELATVGDFAANLALLSSRVATASLPSLSSDGAVLLDKLTGGLNKTLESAAPAAFRPTEEVAVVVKQQVAASRDEITAEIRAELAKEAKAQREELRVAMVKEVSDAVTKDVEASLGAEITKKIESEIRASVATNLKSAVDKELTATKLKSAIDKVPTIKSLADDNRKLRSDLRALASKLAEIEGNSK